MIGTLETDADLRQTTAGDAFLKFCLSVSRPERQDGMPVQSDDIDIVCWNQLAESFSSLKRGDMIVCEGRVTVREQDDESGKRQWFTEVEARFIRKLTEVVNADTSEFSVEQNNHINSSLEVNSNSELKESSFDFEESSQTNSSLEQETVPSSDLEKDVPF